MLSLLRDAIILLLALAWSQVLARAPTQVDPQTMKAQKRMLAASAKMDKACKTMLDAAEKLAEGGAVDSARRDLGKGDALMREGDAEMADGERTLTAEGAMMDSSKLMLEARQTMMDGRAKLMSVAAHVSSPEQLEASRTVIQEARQTMQGGDEKMKTARDMMWNRMQMAR
jgi:hypothetical protein